MTESNAVPESAIRSRLDVIGRTILTLTAEQKALESLLKMAVPVGVAAPSSALRGVGQGGLIDGVDERPSVKAAVVQFVKDNPGQTPTQIADALKDKVSSKSVDVRNVIRTTVAKMAGAGEFRKEIGNRIYPKEDQ